MVPGSTSKTMLGTALAVLLVASLIVASLMVAGCGRTTLTMVTTQEMANSGLLTSILPAFEKQNNAKVTVVAKPTCEAALDYAKSGNADVAMICDDMASAGFVTAGYGYQNVPVAYSDMIVVGPVSDPAAIKGLDCPGKSCKKIGTVGATFVARGDGSDLDKKVMMYWKKAAIDPKGQAWYTTTGKGMAETLKAASQKQGYTITDRQTFESMKDQLNLVKLVEGCAMLMNQYGVLVVNPAKVKDANSKAAGELVWYLTGKTGQAGIGSHKKYGVALFKPNAEKQTHGTTVMNQPASSQPGSTQPAGGMKM
jgi:tungstate transport system substrate-binding protein